MSDLRVFIEPNQSVNGLPFGSPAAHLWQVLGEPTKALQNYNGEVELLYGDHFFRCFEDRFVECTFPTTYHFWINGVEVLSVLDWLCGQADCVEKAKFHISLSVGMAYDQRNPAAGSVTVFEPGRWDYLVLTDAS